MLRYPYIPTGWLTCNEVKGQEWWDEQHQTNLLGSSTYIAYPFIQNEKCVPGSSLYLPPPSVLLLENYHYWCQWSSSKNTPVDRHTVYVHAVYILIFKRVLDSTVLVQSAPWLHKVYQKLSILAINFLNTSTDL